MCADSGTIGLTCARSIRHYGVTVEAVAFVTAVGVHAAMLTWTRFQAALVQIWK